VRDDFSRLDGTTHWLGWLGEDPARAVRDAAEAMLEAQVAGARIEWMQLVDEPHYLTGGPRTPDGKKVLVTRAGLAAPFCLSVRDPGGGVEELRGILSWVASGLDGDRRDRTFLDLGADFAWACKELEARIYEIDRSRAGDA
jgi:hypothetical protein